jgi:hypothetical protein
MMIERNYWENYSEKLRKILENPESNILFDAEDIYDPNTGGGFN